MTKQLNSNQLAEDYISVHLPFRGRSASQVLQDDTTLSSVKLWGKGEGCKGLRSILKCRLRCAYSCMDLGHGLKKMCRSSKISDSTKETIIAQKLKFRSNKWLLWKRFFTVNEKDVMTKKETAVNQQNLRQRKNAGIFIADYVEEQTIDNCNNDNTLELCDLEDSGHYDMKSDKL